MTQSVSNLSVANEGLSSKILIVDDDPSQRKLFAAHLKRSGYEVVEAADGLEALDAVMRVAPDVIIMDVQMPRMNGLECTSVLKSQSATARIPIIMASADTEGTDVIAGLEAGADEYITKPFDPRVFSLRVRSMARLSRVYKQLQSSSDLLSEQNRNLGVILELSFNLGVAGDMKSVFRHVVTAVTNLTGCRSVTLFLPDDQRRVMRLAYPYGEAYSPSGEIELPIGEGITGKVFAEANPAVYEELEQIARDRHPTEAMLLNAAPALSTPLCSFEHAVGVLNVADRIQNRPFTPQELAYLDMVANLSAASIHDLHTQKMRDDAHESIVVALAKLAEHRDSDTGKHLDRVTQYCLTLADALRNTEKFSGTIDDTFMDSMKLAVPLHDIGKVAIPDRILLKPGKLTDAEMSIMRTHVDRGAETIRSVLDRTPNSHFLSLAEHICRCHHEWWDGGGYPAGLAGPEIPLSARIATLADVYDALTTKRVYKGAMPHEKAYNIIVSASGSQFDPDVVQAFIDCEQDFVHLAIELADQNDSTSAPTPTPAVAWCPRDV